MLKRVVPFGRFLEPGLAVNVIHIGETVIQPFVKEPSPTTATAEGTEEAVEGT